MPDLRFSLEGARVAPSAATPELELELRIENAAGDAVHSALVTCQIQIDAPRRRYSAREEALLRDLFGERARWGETLRPLAWARVALQVPGFTERTLARLPLSCTIDVTQGPAKYLFALDEGDVPLTLLFSGTVFHAGPTGALQVGSIPWNREARGVVPVELVRKVSQLHHGGAAFLSLSREVFDRLHAYRQRRGHPSWEHAVESLLARAEDS